MRRSVVRRVSLARFLAAFLLLGAVLPGVTYVGHAPGEDGHTHAVQEDAQQSGEEHVLHCHTGPSICAGAQALVGAIWIGEDPGLITPAPESRSRRDAPKLIMPEAPVLRLLDPPRAA